MVKDGDGNFNYTVSDQVTSTSTYGASTIGAGIDGTGHLYISHIDPHNNGNSYIFDSVEFGSTW
jgi:hypothetical protein